MLNNLTNFFNLITGRRIKRTLERTDLIPLGTRDSSFGGGYKPTAIQAGDFLDNLTVHADGTTIIGDGSVNNPLIAVVSGAPVTYSRVCFVDAINGVDATGAINVFDKPFLTVPAARTAAAALIGIGTNNRALVYIRRGQYNNPTLVFTDNVDFYCEPGVVFTGNVQITDGGVGVNSNVFGSLKVNTSTASAIVLSITGASTITFEFDWINSNTPAMFISPSSTNNRITIKGNYVYSGTIGTGYGTTFRANANAVVNIANAIESLHTVIRFRNFTGNVTINCPNIRLVSGNVYGGNFKQCLYLSDTGSTGSVTINGDLIVADTVNYGGIGCAVTCWDGTPNYKVKINGNVNAGVIKGFQCPVGSNFVLQFTGNATSNQYVAWLYGGGKFLFKNSVITTTSAAHTATAIAVNGTAEVYFKDCYMFNIVTDQPIIEMNSTTVKLILDGCQGRASGTGAGTVSITTTVASGLLYVNNSRFNKAINPLLIDQYVPSGLIIDPNTQVPNIF